MPSLETINQRARDQAFAIEDIDWSVGVNPDLSAFPTEQMPLCFSAGWELLGDDEKRTANQWYGCAVSEQFITLEETFLMPAVHALLRHRGRRLEPALREALEVFLAEEAKHGAMFRRLLLAADPARYDPVPRRSSGGRRQQRGFYAPGKLAAGFATLCLELPTVFVAWPWLGLILEEKTIALHRAYDRAATRGVALDPLHAAVHRFHFLDEARHVQIEAHLVERLWDPASSLCKDINRPLLFSALARYTRPRDKSVSANVVRAVVDKYPRLLRHQDALLQGIADLAHNRRFQRAVYGGDAIPQSFRQLARRPELHGIDGVAPDFADHLAGRARVTP